MRLMLTTRHRRCIILTGQDAAAAIDDTNDDDEVQAVVSVGGDFEPAPAPFGFTSGDDDE